MKKLLALFPNIYLKENCIIWGIRFNILNSSPLLIWQYRNDNEEKFCKRQLEILRCYLMFAAYIEGKNSSLISKVVILQNEKEKILAKEEEKVALNLLANNLPKDLEENAVTICWFARYLEQSLENERSRAFTIYNALGTLPYGFNNILQISSKQEDINMLKILLRRVEDFHAMDNADESYEYKTKALSNGEFKTLENIYLGSDVIENMIKH